MTRVSDISRCAGKSGVGHGDAEETMENPTELKIPSYPRESLRKGGYHVAQSTLGWQMACTLGMWSAPGV